MTKKLSKKNLDEMKQHLLDEKNNLVKELEKFAKKNPHNSEDYDAQFTDIGDDETDNVSEVAQYGLDKSLEHTLEKSLRDVNKAMDAIEKGDYGICKYCNEPIDLPRLKARPTSTSCISCKTKLKSL